MKFCYECGCKLEGNEEVCPECGEVFKNTQSPNDFMESTFNQFLEDIDQLKDNAIEFMKDVDIDDIFDDFSINSKKALNQDAFYVARARRKLENSGDNQRIIYATKHSPSYRTTVLQHLMALRGLLSPILRPRCHHRRRLIRLLCAS